MLTYEEMEEVFSEFDIPLNSQNRDEYPADIKYVGDRQFISSLGYSSLDNLDIDDGEGANVVADLNSHIPKKHVGKYDVVYNNGTLEHIFHTPNALGCVHDLLAPNGYAIHIGPANNYIDHGFYQFCPTLMIDYYTANNWKIHLCYLVNYNKPLNADARYVPYNTRDFEADHLYGKMNEGRWGILFAAQKIEGATKGVVPTQYRYSK